MQATTQQMKVLEILDSTIRAARKTAEDPKEDLTVRDKWKAVQNTVETLKRAIVAELPPSGPVTGINLALIQVKDEILEAQAKFIPFTSPHEGYAVLKEEVDELWEEVKKRPAARDREKMRNEARQVAAMGIRFMLDCTEGL